MKQGSRKSAPEKYGPRKNAPWKTVPWKIDPRKLPPSKIAPQKIASRKIVPYENFWEFFLISSFCFYDNFRPSEKSIFIQLIFVL